MKLTGLILLAFILGCQGRHVKYISLSQGITLPEFEINLIDKSIIDTRSLKPANPFVLMFFSSECPFCRSMIGKIADNHEKFKNTEFYLISNESDSKLQEIAKEFKLQKYLNIKIGRDSKNIFFDKFKVKGVPYFAIFGSDKKVKLDFSGTIEPDELYSVITN